MGNNRRHTGPKRQADAKNTGQEAARRENPRDADVHTERSGGAQATEANEAMNERFTGDGAEGERGYRGTVAPDTPPGSVPGGSHGAGGGASRGSLPRDAEEGARERP